MTRRPHAGVGDPVSWHANSGHYNWFQRMRIFFTPLLLVLIEISASSQSLNSASPSDNPKTANSKIESSSVQPAQLSADQVIAAAHEKLERGDAQGAISTLEELESKSATSPRGLQHELGVAYYRTGKLTAAEQAFARAMKQDSNDVEAVQMRGLTLYRLGRPAEAIPLLERVRQWTPNANADANYVLGLCYLNSQRFDDARTAFAAQFAVPPNSGAAYLLLAKMLKAANLPEDSAAAARKALELTANLPLAHFLLGEFYLSKQDMEQALREFEQERVINPANFAVYDRLGDVYTRSERYEKAQEALAKAISLDTSSTGPFIQMGKVLLRRNDPQTSLLYLQHAEKMDPGNYITHTLLAQAYRSLGRSEESKKEFEAASKIHGEMRAEEQQKMQSTQ